MNIDFYWYKEKLYVIEVILIRWCKEIVEDGKMVLGCKIIYLYIFESYIFVIFVF